MYKRGYLDLGSSVYQSRSESDYGKDSRLSDIAHYDSLPVWLSLTSPAHTGAL